MAPFSSKQKPNDLQGCPISIPQATSLIPLPLLSLLFIPLYHPFPKPMRHTIDSMALLFPVLDADAEAEAPVLWPPDVKSWLIRKDPDAGEDWGQEEKGITEDKMVGWHHRFSGHEFGQAPGVGDGQGSLACCSPWGSKELDTTEWLNWTDSLMRDFHGGSDGKNLPAV